MSNSIAISVTDLLRDPERKLTESQAAIVCGIEPQTLAAWRCTRRYDLPFIRVGRAIRYRAGDVSEWLKKNTVMPTSIQD